MTEPRRILKFPLPPEGEAVVGTGSEPQVLSVGWQERQLVVWVEALVGHTHLTRFQVVMTGDPVPVDDHAVADYVGTAQLHGVGGEYVVHVYRWLPRG